jgi:hypothetical protein
MKERTAMEAVVGDGLLDLYVAISAEKLKLDTRESDMLRQNLLSNATLSQNMGPALATQVEASIGRSVRSDLINAVSECINPELHKQIDSGIANYVLSRRITAVTEMEKLKTFPPGVNPNRSFYMRLGMPVPYETALAHRIPTCDNCGEYDLVGCSCVGYGTD